MWKTVQNSSCVHLTLQAATVALVVSAFQPAHAQDAIHFSTADILTAQSNATGSGGDTSANSKAGDSGGTSGGEGGSGESTPGRSDSQTDNEGPRDGPACGHRNQDLQLLV